MDDRLVVSGRVDVPGRLARGRRNMTACRSRKGGQRPSVLTISKGLLNLTNALYGKVVFRKARGQGKAEVIRNQVFPRVLKKLYLIFWQVCPLGRIN